jgi:hypothetical protein
MPKGTAAERRIKLRNTKAMLRAAEEIERAAYEKFMKNVGIPMLIADEVSLRRLAQTRAKNRHQLLYEAMEFAAGIADMAEQKQDADYGSANTGGAALVAATIRAYAETLQAHREIDDLFLLDWVSMDTAPKDGRSILIAIESGAVGEARHVDGSGWYWSGSDPTDQHDGSVDAPVAWQPMPIYQKKS